MIKSFETTLKFTLDKFQKEAIEKITQNDNVLVCAPTGSGKTVVAQFSIHKAICENKKVFYTTPIKALSNQKYRELLQEHGEVKVGLLTGDIAINPDAQIVVMTTEVLRNMIYENSKRLENLSSVILDEVHYLSDEFRGPIWEEIIIHLDYKVQIVALSATISNSKQFANWIRQCRYSCELIETSHRPVPLYQKMLVGNKIYDLFAEGKSVDTLGKRTALEINDSLLNAIQKVPADHTYRRFRPQILPRHKIVSLLAEKSMLPAIFFIFSRANCEEAMNVCLDKKIDLTTDEEKVLIQERFQVFYENIDKTDHKNLNLHKWAKCLINGYATHHAGLLPIMKEFVERLFADGLIKVVFATGTLALGVNMPAKTVILESLYTWNGKAHVMLSPIEFTQLAGRAGRRGIDTLGNVVVVYDGSAEVEDYFELATSRDYELNSVFKPTYNMVANLLKTFSPQEVEDLLRSSFAQFQGNESITAYVQKIKKEEKLADKFLNTLSCSKGNFLEYAELKTKLSKEQSKLKYEKFLRQKQYNEIFLDEYCKVGAIFTYKKGRHRKYGIAIAKPTSRGNSFFTVVTEKGNKKKIFLDSLQDNMVAFVTQIHKHELKIDDQHLLYEAFYNVKSAKKLGMILQKIVRKKDTFKYKTPEKAQTKDIKRLSDLENKIYQHECNNCPDKRDHLNSYRKYKEHSDNISHYERLIDLETGNISKLFTNIMQVLEKMGYIDENYQLTEKGYMLSEVYSENDLLVTQAISEGIFEDIEPSVLACLISACIYSGRKNSSRRMTKKYARSFEGTHEKLYRIYKKIDQLQKKNHLSEVHDIDFGLVEVLYPWSNGIELSQILSTADIEAGDFVRWCKQVKDLLSQIENLNIPEVSLKALIAKKAINRSIVAWSSV
ncbi:DEAD/DEAH box helicase [Actinomyces sp. zg-332]|uniref:DEAD/DEAH box helicase n=1 Tax=Actinomyces sp. zg-332 TaxID=2708340 RepID=UPI0014244CF3|nr:DEAD/DEAH box helicase [Actinomyces sp. zg-332]QPK93678.1 DEAD/DEAH box helicase [Actinomyces sp. zg-332]